jgi:hypothetical protein
MLPYLFIYGDEETINSLLLEFVYWIEPWWKIKMMVQSGTSYGA